MVKSWSTHMILAHFLAGVVLGQHLPEKNAPGTATEIIRQSQLAFHYPGTDMKANVTMELIDNDGGKRTRILTMLRKNQSDGGDQKFFIYFHEPGDVRRLTYMVWKYTDREDDRWIFVPAVDLIRRIAADDKFSSFVGTDFTYEDISGRAVTLDNHQLVREDTLSGRDCYVIESVPLEAALFTKRVSWIDKKILLPLKDDYYDAQHEIVRVFTADQIQDIPDGNKTISYPTVIKRSMRNVKTGHRTEVTFTSVLYDLGISNSDFSERRMRRPPPEWIR